MATVWLGSLPDAEGCVVSKNAMRYVLVSFLGLEPDSYLPESSKIRAIRARTISWIKVSVYVYTEGSQLSRRLNKPSFSII